MLHLSLSLRALVFVLLLGIVVFTGGDVAHGTPSAAGNLFPDNLIQFQTQGPDVAHDINMADNKGGLRFYGCPALTVTPNCAAIQFFGNASSGFPGQLFLDAGSTANGAIIFRTAASGAVAERIRVTADGKVGIGTTSPSGRLEVNGDWTGSTGALTLTGDKPTIRFNSTQGAGGNEKWVIHNSSHAAGGLEFSEGTDGSTWNSRMIIAPTGKVGIGTTTPNARLEVQVTSDPNEGFGAGAGKAIYANTSVAGGVAVTGIYSGTGNHIGVLGQSDSGIGVLGTSANGYAGDFQGTVKIRGQLLNNADTCFMNCPSDIRLKRDIQPLNPVLAALTALEPVEFSWRTEEFPTMGVSTERTVGLIAQDVEPVLPELVFEDDKGYKGVRYEQLPVLLLEGVKELKAENDALRTELAVKDDQLATVEARLAVIEQRLNGATAPLVAAR
jgi:hypothetical protein